MSKIARKRTREEADESSEPTIGKCYMVERMDGGGDKAEKMIASIVHVDMRPETGKMMYYVHYEALDRRNDEWVPRERIHEHVDPHGLLISEEQAKGRALTRSQRRLHEEFNHLKQGYDTMDAMTAMLEREHEERTKVKNIPHVVIGKYRITSWYYSPFPAEYNDQPLFMCEYCLIYTPSMAEFKHHSKKCKERQPPGNEIYRKDNLSVYEMDGDKYRCYCQSLCLLSKLFMDHKTLYFDVHDFMFYVLCEVDRNGAHIVGYFSREIESINNLACIMVFPPFQDKGYGKFLIQLSYVISSREGYIGTPEKPLSDLGKVSYRSYWWWVLLKVLHRHPMNTIYASELSQISGVAVDDIVSTLGTMKMVKQCKDGEYLIRSSRKIVDHCLANDYGKPPRILLDPECLLWKPATTRRQTSNENTRKTSTSNSTPSNGPQSIRYDDDEESMSSSDGEA